jgi:RNA polymerase sigma-70 factor (ECF subfamily)
VPRPQLLYDEQQLVARAQRGDTRAFERLYRHYAPAIFAQVLVPMLGHRADAQDCLRDTFIAAHGALKSFSWTKAGIWPWLKTTAKNKARDLLRASGRRQRLRGAYLEYLESVAGPDAETVQKGLFRADLREQIDARFEEIKPRYARVLRLRLLEDRSREECAELLDVKLGALDVLMYRAVRAFRKAWEQYAANAPEFPSSHSNKAANP